MSNVQRLLSLVDEYDLRLSLARTKGGWEASIIHIKVGDKDWPFGPVCATTDEALEGLAALFVGKMIAVEVSERVKVNRPLGVFAEGEVRP